MVLETDLEPSRSLVIMAIISKTVIPSAFNRIGDNDLRLHPQLARTGAILLHYSFGHNEKEFKEMATLYCSFYNGIALVRPESKQSRSWSRSRYFRAGVVVEVA